jgi:pimeloyl-ACP methyl ester carboxylesterase
MLYARLMTIEQRSMETTRGRMAWLEAGAGWPVVLLHAFPLTADMWRPQLEAVPSGWRFIAPDFRGFGRSLPPKGGSHTIGDRDSWLPPSGGREITMDDYAADVFALMDGLKLDDAVIGGLSMGGYVTFAMHRLEPARFTGMVLADTRPQADTPQGRDGRVKLREILAADGPRGVAGQMLPKLLSEAARQEGSEALRQTRTMIEGAAPAAIDAAIGALMSRPDSTPGLSQIACSTIVIVGERDEITPVADAEALQRAIGRSTLTVIPGAGHLASLEQPAVFSRGLADFLLARL